MNDGRQRFNPFVIASFPPLHTATRNPPRVTVFCWPIMTADSIRPCDVCSRGVGHSSQIQFFTLELAQHILDFDAIRQHTALELQVGSPALARAFDPDPEVSKEARRSTYTICQECFCERFGKGWQVLIELGGEATA